MYNITRRWEQAAPETSYWATASCGRLPAKYGFCESTIATDLQEKNGINQLVFLIKEFYVVCEVRIVFLYVRQINFSFRTKNSLTCKYFKYFPYREIITGSVCELHVVRDEVYERAELYHHKDYHGLWWTVMPVNRFLGSFAQSRNAPVSSVVSFGLPVRLYEHGFHWTDFRKIWYWGLTRKSVTKLQIWLKLDSIVGHFT